MKNGAVSKKTSCKGVSEVSSPRCLKIYWKWTLCFANFCLTMDLNHRKSMTVWKLCEKSSKCDVAGNRSFIRLEMAKVWRKKSLIEKSAHFNFFPMSNFGLSVFVNDAAQDCLSYSLSMSKLKSFKFSLKWHQEWNFYSIHSNSILQLSENMKILYWVFQILDHLSSF